MTTDLYRRAFSRAAEILSGEEKLARYLHADQQELRAWKRRGPPPIEAVHLLAELFKHQLLKKYAQSAIGRTRTRARSR
jgi:hypothetical protein